MRPQSAEPAGHPPVPRVAEVFGVDRQAILDKLGEIDDPCSVAAGRTMDIVTMGLIGRLDIEGATVILTLVLTEPVCWYSGDLMAYAQAKIRSVAGVQDVRVSLDTDSIWTPDRIRRMPPFLGKIPVVTKRP
jgi:metal-sulfur cluster biosynthetic enzyme